MTRLPLISLFFTTLLTACATAQTPLNVADFGAVGDGNQLNTAAIQKAIDQAAAAGGGTVLVPEGTFLTGTIVLRNNVTLHLEKGATLLGSTKHEDYPITDWTFVSNKVGSHRKALIYANKAENITISGEGAIDGQGQKFPRWSEREPDPEKRRPLGLHFVECRNVTLKNLTLRSSAYWMQHYLGCDGVRIDGITVENDANKNNDGIDIDSTQNVHISNCKIKSEDDSICLKSTSAVRTKNVVVENCNVSSRCNGLKMGTESSGGFENITIRNCTVTDTRLCGLALEIVDGGTMDNVKVSDIQMKNVGGAIFIRLGDRGRPIIKDGPKPPVGKLQNVTIENIKAEGVSPIGSCITGVNQTMVENITLRNVDLTFAGGGGAETGRKKPGENADQYPEFNMFGNMPAYGLFIRHAKNVTLEDVKLGYASDDHRPAVVADDVTQLTIRGLQAKATDQALALIKLSNVQAATVRQNTVQSNPKTFVLVEGPRSHSIQIGANELNGAKAVELHPQVKNDAVSQ